MQIFVKTLSGRSLVVDIQPTSTVYQLKAKIYEKETIPPDQQKLVYSGELATPTNYSIFIVVIHYKLLFIVQ